MTATVTSPEPDGRSAPDGFIWIGGSLFQVSHIVSIGMHDGALRIHTVAMTYTATTSGEAITPTTVAQLINDTRLYQKTRRDSEAVE